MDCQKARHQNEVSLSFQGRRACLLMTLKPPGLCLDAQTALDYLTSHPIFSKNQIVGEVQTSGQIY